MSARHKNRPQAWVVFSNSTDLFWLKLLRKGFRHCSVLINDGHHWISYDPLSNYTDIIVHDLAPGFDLPGWLEERNHTLIKARMCCPARPAPWMLLTCVEAVKRLLGIQKFFIFTPWQLYKYLKAQSHSSQSQHENPQPHFSLNKGEISWEH